MTKPIIILLTWNLNFRISRIKDQIKAVVKHNADILTFQEVTLSSKTLLKGEILKNGYEYIEDSFTFSKEQTKLKGKRKYGQMIASRYPFKSRKPDEFSVPWKERILSADINTEYGKIEIHTTHIPPGSTNGWIKIQMLEGIFKKLNRNSKKLRMTHFYSAR